LLIEVADTTLGRDRGEKQLAYSGGGVPIYWIVNLVDGQLEVYAEPSPSGYRQRCVLASDEQVRLEIDGDDVGAIAIASMVPRPGKGGAGQGT
jgi:Uma2 family endonuclease